MNVRGIFQPIALRALAAGMVASLALSQPALAANRQNIVTEEELKEVIEPGRLIYHNGRRLRRLTFESLMKQMMDNRHSQEMVDDVAKLFWSKKYRPVTLILDHDRPPVVIDPNRNRRPTPPPPQKVPLPEIATLPSDQLSSNPGATEARPPQDPGVLLPTPSLEEARDLETGIHDEILRVMRQQGYNVAALKVFAQTLSLVKVIMIVSTRDLPDHQIRPTLRQIRSIIETEVLQAKFPAVHLAELSSFTLLNERDGHFYEHPVLYWQLNDPQWHSGQAPTSDSLGVGDGPQEGQVSTQGSVDDYFTSNEFVPEADFDEEELLGAPLQGL